ncbi:DUF3604 domain-containing protein [Halieaceae bacterium IMCC14734]|uniref:DUF3604 domain-containing protein n=1 Tax=Candidatus Litorirhabdus singularis TaxID=2518993 RepID=A0ABT3TE02_9GAMM|nr:DUF3604 domain-containing protein [Candidatus Litorirhabdus singularis]MCX2980526.1 DUF3604 domain-containing protein [Candidatus Litorirhabdus singularis]
MMSEGIKFLLMLTAVQVLLACSRVDDPSLLPAYDASTAAPVPAKQLTEFSSSRNLYWGDLHIHTSYSTDAWTMGVRATPDHAYTFTRGGEIEHAGGYGIQLQRPLDFAAVTDHSEYLGLLRATEPSLPLSQRSFKQRMHSDGKLRNTIAFLRTTLGFSLDNVDSAGWQEFASDAWEQTIAAAERHNNPGRFTTFLAYEWSSMPGDNNLHRNVIYRSTAAPAIPYSSLNSEDPRDLWAELERQRELGMDNFAIPHNGNASNGLMYDSVVYDGGVMNGAYAARRMINEPISEIYQVKGSSETHPQLSPEDTFAGFEIVDTRLSQDLDLSQPKGSYARDALRRGIEMSHSEGFNPYRFGVIGSSDGHNASSPVEEDNFHGKLPLLDGSAATRLRTNSYMPAEIAGGKLWNAAGLAAVWAEENTREALFDAMRRKETYATSGPRIGVRFFGGWNYQPDMLAQPDWIELAEARGVPMGGKLPPAAQADVPGFAVWAIRDPTSGNLDRIQIVKGWVAADGASRETVFDVVWSDGRQLDARGQLPTVGNTVDAEAATFANTIGAAQLSGVWYDRQFDAAEEAFYYARVIEIPTPRWTTYDAKALGIEAPLPNSLQERAVTSAIWYQPAQAAK